MIEPEVTFNMDLANGPTSQRFCYEAASVLGLNVSEDDETELANHDAEFADEVVEEWTGRLESAGYAVRWDAGDVVVWDLRDFSDEDRDAFYEEMFS